MPEALQFHCPACGISLRIPMAAAGTEGPCPRCAQNICAPDPAHHLPPRRLSAPGSIHAMMERISRTRSGEVPAPAQDPYAALPRVAPPSIPPAEPPRYAPPPQPVTPPPEPIPVKYPPFDTSPPPPAAPPPEPVYYPWHELAAAPAPLPPPVVPQPAPSPAPAQPAIQPAVATSTPPPAIQPAPPILPAAPPRPEPPSTIPLTPQRPVEIPAPREQPPKTVAIPAPAPALTERTAPTRTFPDTSPQPSIPATARLEPEAPVAVMDRSSAPFSRPLTPTPAFLPLSQQIPPAAADKDSRRTILLLACWVTGIVASIVSFSAGYYVGNRFPFARFESTPAVLPAHPPETTPGIPVLPHQPDIDLRPPPAPQPDPAPSRVKEDSTAAKLSAPADPPSSSSAPPVYEIPADLDKTVRTFLTAPNRAARLRTMLFPERTRAKLEAWHATRPDGPFPTGTFVLDGQLKDRSTGLNCVIFTFFDSRYPDGIPLITMDTPDGWRVDWESFVEFHEDSFGRFSEGPVGAKGRFHLSVRNVNYFGDRFPGIEKLTAFRIDPPLPDRIKYAFVATGSQAHKDLAALTDDGSPVTAVLDLAMREAGKNVPYLEITAVAAPDWIPR